MRITTQMLNASMRKAGLPVSNVSLLSYINGSSGQGNSLVNALKKNGINIQDKSYGKMRDQAEKLQQAAENMLSEEMFKEARKSGDKQAICDKAKELVQNYNGTMKSMKNATSPLSQFYRQMLGGVAADQKEKLKEIGTAR